MHFSRNMNGVSVTACLYHIVFTCQAFCFVFRLLVLYSGQFIRTWEYKIIINRPGVAGAVLQTPSSLNK